MLLLQSRLQNHCTVHTIKIPSGTINIVPDVFYLRHKQYEKNCYMAIYAYLESFSDTLY